MLSDLGKFLILIGGLLVVVGLLLTIGDPFPFLRLGRLPGDFVYRRGNFTFYFPLVTSILLSLLLTVLFWLFGRH